MFLFKTRYQSSLFSTLREKKYFLINHRNKNQCAKEIKIGNVSKAVSYPKNPHLVPIGYIKNDPTQTLIGHLQWIMRKDILKQDMFLIGLPGPQKSNIILQYLELMQKEVEYVVLSRDTTESDLKQRREILNDTAHYVDQSAVKAAKEGRFLVLDGIEKVERNVLPVLNNLLENREMQLEDGHFLMSAERYDKLLLKYSKETLNKWKLLRVSENFRVVALGLPVPYFRGNPLDPPFRSRFQAQCIQPTFGDHYEEFSKSLSNISSQTLRNFLLVCYSFLPNESMSLDIPKFPVENLHSALKILNLLPTTPLEHLFKWLYPYTMLFSAEKQRYVLETLDKFSIFPIKYESVFLIKKCISESDKSLTHNVEFSMNGEKSICNILGCNDDIFKTSLNYVSNPYHHSVLADMLKTHTVHDFCLIGHRGSGKSILVKKFASLLNYSIEIMMLYADMTARDLLQQRVTDENGNTLWQVSRLIKAAEEGKLLVLDGLHRLHSSTLSVLQRLIHHREMQLYNGTRLIRHDRYDLIKLKCNLSDIEMRNRNILRIHPSFRIIALAEPPKSQNLKHQWITPELMSMFLFHTIRPLSLQEEKKIVVDLVGQVNEKMDIIFKFAHALRNSEDEVLRNVGASFSTRQLIRMARRLSVFPDENIYSLITGACLMKFLPRLTQQAIEKLLENYNIIATKKTEQKTIHISNEQLVIGSTAIPIDKTDCEKVKVPDVLFYDNQEHLDIMESMLQNFSLGEHLLLVGNQGVGKNKITDRFLQLLNRSREYIQLHRDTTVQSLIQQTSIVDGRIVYQDSPLLKAVQQGNVLVVDEADKAPTHVTNILKALVESGEMILSDNRCIVHHTDLRSQKESNVVIMHPDFRMIILANRPGFPFLGNDFFAVLGDIFSCHAVDNPTLDSEIAMLHQYEPDVPKHLLWKLARLFGELRYMSDAGLISYPYSTREVVNIVKHLGKFPDESIYLALRNVFDFDIFNTEFKEILNCMFQKHGIPVQNQEVRINTGKSFNLPNLCFKTIWEFDNDKELWQAEMYKLCKTEVHSVFVKEENLDFIEGRANTFSEELSYCQLHLNSNDVPLDIASLGTNNNNNVYVATANPISLYILNQNKMLLKSINISSYFPTVRSGFKPKVKISIIRSGQEDILFFHESTSDQSFLIQPLKGFVQNVKHQIPKLSNIYYSRPPASSTYSFAEFPSRRKLVLYKKHGTKLTLLDFETSIICLMKLPENIKNVISPTENCLFLEGKESNFIADISDLSKWKIRKLSIKNKPLGQLADFKMIKPGETLNTDTNAAQVYLVSNAEDYATVIIGSFFGDSALKIYSFPRRGIFSIENESCILPSNYQIIRFLQASDISQDLIELKEANSGYLEVTDIQNVICSYIAVNLPQISSYARWLANSSKNYLLMCLSSDEKLITIDMTGCVRQWETDHYSLKKSFKQWEKSIVNKNEQLTIEHTNFSATSVPKYGKTDPTGSPHVGGNMWAGGTGGRDTSGLGGKGGPYRLDAGDTVYQLSDFEKVSVPFEVKQAASEMAAKAYKDKLKQIDMSEYDAELYEQFLCSVKKQVNLLRVILDGLQAKNKERLWVKHQTSGEFDDAKLVESITGEKAIYKRRGDKEPEIGSLQTKPKLLKLVADVSASMYRFNGHDNRLQRELECVVLVMEAFDGYFEKFQYEIIGHSGEDFHIKFSKSDKPPKNNKDRLNIIKRMHAHTQFCMSGDSTLVATENAIKTIVEYEADEYFVILMSDANFDRYGISAKGFGKLLLSNPRVNAFAIFIGSLGNQANTLLKQLPTGRGFMCFNSSELPQIMQHIFTSAILQD